MNQPEDINEIINVIIELDPSLKQFSVPKKEDKEILERDLMKYLTNLTLDLKIPATISLDIKYGKDNNRFTMTSYRVTINDNECRFPLPSLISENVQIHDLAKSIARGIYRNPEILLNFALVEKIREQWLTVDVEGFLYNMDPIVFKEFLLEFVRRQFHIGRAKNFSDVIRKKMSFDTQFFYNLLSEKSKIDWDIPMIFEECVSEWNNLTFKVYLPAENPLNWRIGKDTSELIDYPEIKNVIELMSDGLFYELGIMVPKLVFEIDESLKDGEFSIQLNDLHFPPISGLKKGYFLVNDTVERLKLIKISGNPAINPANGSICAFVRDENGAREICEEAGLTTWDPIDFIILALSAEFRQYADSFLNIETVDYYMKQLKQAFPGLINAIQERFSISELTGILRDLLKENVSIRDFRGIMEILLEIHTLKRKSDTHERTLSELTKENFQKFLEPQIDRNEAISYIRTGLKKYLSNKHSSRENTLIVSLTDGDIDMKIGNGGELLLEIGSKDHQKLIKNIFDKLGNVSMTGQNAVVLTTQEVRKKLRNLIEKEFPGLAVLCYQELGEDMNIQPIDRINLN